MVNLTFENNKLLIDGIEYDVTNYQLVLPGIHIFLYDGNIHNPVIYLIPSDTIINGVQMITNDDIILALNNPPIYEN